MKGRILVTGAAGFIGSFVSKELIRRQYEVLGVDSLTRFYSTDLKKLRLSELQPLEGFEFLELDISSRTAVGELYEHFQFDGVIHLAAQAGVRLPLKRAYEYINNNIVGFHNILERTVEKGVRNLLYASSSSVYGDESPLPYTEASRGLKPKSFYGVTKLTNEFEASIYGSNSETSIRGLRFFTVYGPWGRPDMAYFRLMASALGHHEFTLFGDGTIQRDFTYINDVSETTVDLLENLVSTNSRVNDLVNIGGMRPLSMQFLIELVESVSGKQLNITFDQANANDSKITMADNSYLTSLLGPRTFTPLESGIDKLRNWMSQPNVKTRISDWIKSSN